MDRFWDKVDKQSDGCWLWLGSKTPPGYGRIRFGKQTVYAHRVAYENDKGLIPEGLTIDHLCRNRACVNPTHLEAVTLNENIARSLPYRTNVPKRRTHCLKGHVLSGDNIYRRPDRPGDHSCALCNRERARKHHKAKRDAKLKSYT